MEPEFVNCTNIWLLKEEPQEVEDIIDTGPTGADDWVSETVENNDKGGNLAIKQELHDEEEGDFVHPITLVEPRLEDHDQTHEESFNQTDYVEKSPDLMCANCNKTFTSLQSLETHHNTCQSVIEPAVPQQLIINVQSLATKVDGVKMYLCRQCEYKTHDSWKMKRHAVRHTGARLFRCDLCEKSYTTASNLAEHRHIHSGDRRHKCADCEYASNSASNLKAHMVTHTGERKFGCKLCVFKAASSKTLKDHMKVHTGERPYGCTECEYRATTGGALNRHIRVKHIGEKTYACDHCEYKTADRSDLTKHLKSRHINKSS